MDDLNALRATSLWPEFPFLRVERRLDFRFDQPLCFVYATERDTVVPRVYFTPAWPPPPANFDIENSPGLTYQDLAALVADGWRVADG